ncbi:MAG: tape measure protein [Oscillospiraceae bacterium]|nr:tape measure protein [Oscillospiraceae bacterium]
MGILENRISLTDAFSAPILGVINAVNATVDIMRQAQTAIDGAFDATAIQNAQNAINNANAAMERFCETGQGAAFNWQSDSDIPVFDTTGVERYQQELNSANELMNQLANTQGRLTQHAQYRRILPEGAANDIIAVEQRISTLQQRIQRISANPMRVVSPTANNQLEQLRQQLNSAVQLQNQMNAAVDNMDVERANRAYLELCNTVGNTERYIRDNIGEQGEFNSAIRQGQGEADKLISMIKKVGGAYIGVKGLGKAMDLSDTLISTTARLDLMNDGLQSTADLQNMIFASAERARGLYAATADAIAKLGNNAGSAFDSTAEIVAFMEQVNKQFVIAGTEASGVQAAMLQLTQAMGSGVLRGEEFNSILEQAPTIIQAIADYMGVPKGKLKDLASEGMITSDIVKNAMFAAANDTNAKFNSMPKTFSQIWTSFTNNALMSFQPVLNKMNELANDTRVTEGIQIVLDLLAILADVALTVLGDIATAASWVADNWSVIGPIVGAAAVALGIYGAALIAVKGAQLAAQAAQMLLNGSMLACPVFWLVAGFAALVGIIALYTNSVNDAYGLTLSFGGMLGGAIMTILAALGNLVIMLCNIAIENGGIVWNFIADFVNFFANVWTDPLGSVVRLFTAVFDAILSMIETAVRAIGSLLGKDWGSEIESFRKQMNEAVQQTYGTGVEVVPKVDKKQWTLKYINYDEAFDAGYYIGEEFGNKFDYANEINNVLNSDYLGDIAAYNGSIAANTDDISDAVSRTEEDLKYLRDLAEQEVINRFTTAEIKIDWNNTQNISSEMDLDGVTEYFEIGLLEAAERVAQGVH